MAELLQVPTLVGSNQQYDGERARPVAGRKQIMEGDPRTAWHRCWFVSLNLSSAGRLARQSESSRKRLSIRKEFQKIALELGIGSAQFLQRAEQRIRLAT